MSNTILNTLLVLVLSSTMLSSQKAVKQAKELGEVRWLRNYDEALLKASEEDKLILILFQEVPGCATCRNYGNQVLSHPLIVDAIENEFVPLAIFNNVGGHDKAILEKYKEPSWNNPVVRIVTSEGKNVMQRMAGDYSAERLCMQMSLALRAASKGVPKYLELLKDEFSASNKQTAYYKMYCFWSGEAHLGAREGVIATEPGWMNGAEVVKVTYNGQILKQGQLDRYAEKENCETIPKKRGYRIDKDPQYYLKKSKYSILALSEIQKTKINAALAARQDPSIYLSPTQKAQLISPSTSKKLYTLGLEKAWSQMLGKS